MTAKEYIDSANDLLEYYTGQTEPLKLTSASFKANLPSAVRNEVTNVVKSIIRSHEKGNYRKLPVLKKRVITWNNQNYKINTKSIELPVMIDGKSKRISVGALLTEYQTSKLNGKLGSLRITKKNNKWIAQVAVDVEPCKAVGNNIMGVDLGLKVPAVAVTSTGKTKFFGNGRQNKYMKRKFKSKRQRLGKAKKQKAIKKTSSKEKRWANNQDHLISRQIINFAIDNNVSVINLEKLSDIRNTTRTSRKNNYNLHSWSFYRLAQYIKYKAKLSGISVVDVNPCYTSQACPHCRSLNKTNDRNYICDCGYHGHRDRVGAVNIISAPVIVGNRQSA